MCVWRVASGQLSKQLSQEVKCPFGPEGGRTQPSKSTGAGRPSSLVRAKVLEVKAEPQAPKATPQAGRTRRERSMLVALGLAATDSTPERGDRTQPGGPLPHSHLPIQLVRLPTRPGSVRRHGKQESNSGQLACICQESREAVRPPLPGVRVLELGRWVARGRTRLQGVGGQGPSPPTRGRPRVR